jgi:hypothetical protein
MFNLDKSDLKVSLKECRIKLNEMRDNYPIPKRLISIKRKDPIIYSSYPVGSYGYWQSAVQQYHDPNVTHTQVTIERAIEMIIDYLDLEYFDGDPKPKLVPHLIKAKKR